jgi:hypothetical protein
MLNTYSHIDTQVIPRFYVCTSCEVGTAVAQWLRYYATNQKVAVLIPDCVMEYFIDINP